MRPITNLDGKTFGRWRVLAYFGSTKHHASLWVCVCSCGTEKVVSSAGLNSGRSRSCGCLHKEVVGRMKTKHGKHKTAIYSVWRSIKGRCLNKSDSAFPYYGGRGITVCKRWMKFENFYADMGEPKPGMSIDRIDNDRDYRPSNCRWVDRNTQMRNTRANRMLTAYGKTKCAAAWCEQFGLNKGTLKWRLSAGWPVERAVSEPAVAGRKFKAIVAAKETL